MFLTLHTLIMVDPFPLIISLQKMNNRPEVFQNCTVLTKITANSLTTKTIFNEELQTIDKAEYDVVFTDLNFNIVFFTDPFAYNLYQSMLGAIQSNIDLKERAFWRIIPVVTSEYFLAAFRSDKELDSPVFETMVKGCRIPLPEITFWSNHDQG